jgi:hypothetical protein
MKTRTMWITLVVAAILVLLAGAAGAIPTRLAPATLLDGAIHYQGRLTDDMGNPLDGTYDMQFQLYDDPLANTLLWDSGVVNVDVDQGLFEVKLNVDPADFDGQGLWLHLYVEGESLAPRQELLPVPYALSLRPGTEIRGEPTGWEGWVVNVEMEGAYPLGNGISSTAATGAAVAGSSPGGWGLRAYTEEGYAVYGVDDGIDQARGYGGYFTSNTGIGVYGYSSATSVVGNAYTPGVHGRSEQGIGVFGLSDSLEAGVFGLSDGIGVQGRTRGNDINSWGVYGSASDGLAYGVYGYQGDNITGGLGVYGQNAGGGSAVSGYNQGDGNGTWGFSISYNGVGGGTNRGDNNYGLYTADNLYSLNYHLSGAILQVVENGGEDPLERGDLVAIAGMGAPAVEGRPPLLQVQKANEADSTAVVGVVASSYPGEWLVDQGSIDPTGATVAGGEIPLTGPGPVAPGDYLLVVVQGPAQVKASAVAGAIHPGDLLSSAGQAGYAARAAEVEIERVRIALPGTVVGKALEPLAADQALIYVFVTLQ